MKKPQGQYTVRIDGPITDEALRKFALVVSDALTRLSKLTSKTNVVNATIDKAGVISGTKLTLNHGTGHSVTLDPAAATGAVTLTLQQKTFKDDSVAWVLCAAV